MINVLAFLALLATPLGWWWHNLPERRGVDELRQDGEQ